MHKEEIITASKKIFNEFSDTCLQIPDNKFFSAHRKMVDLAKMSIILQEL